MSGPVPVGVQCSCCSEQPRAADNKAFLWLSATDLRTAAWLRSDSSLSNRNLLDHKSDLRVCTRLQKHGAVGMHAATGRTVRPGPGGVVWCVGVRVRCSGHFLKAACKTCPSYINIFLPKCLWRWGTGRYFASYAMVSGKQRFLHYVSLLADSHMWSKIWG